MTKKEKGFEHGPQVVQLVRPREGQISGNGRQVSLILSKLERFFIIFFQVLLNYIFKSEQIYSYFFMSLTSLIKYILL